MTLANHMHTKLASYIHNFMPIQMNPMIYCTLMIGTYVAIFSTYVYDNIDL